MMYWKTGRTFSNQESRSRILPLWQQLHIYKSVNHDLSLERFFTRRQINLGLFHSMKHSLFDHSFFNNTKHFAKKKKIIINNRIKGGNLSFKNRIHNAAYKLRKDRQNKGNTLMTKFV